MAKKSVYWTPLAIESLKATADFISSQWNDPILNYFLDLIDKRIDQLKINPGIAPVIKNTNFRKLIIHKNVSLFYIIDSKIIKILLIWDNRQNPHELIKKLTESDKSGYPRQML